MAMGDLMNNDLVTDYNQIVNLARDLGFDADKLIDLSNDIAADALDIQADTVQLAADQATLAADQGALAASMAAVQSLTSSYNALRSAVNSDQAQINNLQKLEAQYTKKGDLSHAASTHVQLVAAQQNYANDQANLHTTQSALSAQQDNYKTLLHQVKVDENTVAHDQRDLTHDQHDLVNDQNHFNHLVADFKADVAQEAILIADYLRDGGTNTGVTVHIEDNTITLDLSLLSSDNANAILQAFTGQTLSVFGEVIAHNDTATTDQNSPVTIDALANDTHTTGNPVSISSVDAHSADGATVTIVNGELVYDPGTLFAYLAQGATATDTFHYTITDGTISSTATDTITIVGLNDAPVASEVDKTTDQNTALNNVHFSATDVDQGSVLTYSIVADGVNVIDNHDGTYSLAAGGTVTNNGDGTFSFDPGTAFIALPQGATDTVSFSYVANDGTVDSNQATVNLSVTGLNDAPVVNPVSVSTDQSHPVTGLFAGSDVDQGSVLTYSIVADGTNLIDDGNGHYHFASTNEVLVNNGDGSFTFDPSGTLPSGQTENLNFSYIANDGVINSLSAVGSITEVASQTAGTGGTGGSSGTGATGTGATGGAVGTGATGPALPTVDILPGTDATESGTHGSFSVNLEGPALANDLTVNFVTSGTAVDGVAYSDIGTSVVILHGQTSANIDISPINLGIIGGSESITLSLASSQSYQVDSLLNQATISIIDDLAGTQTTTGSQAGATPGIAQKALAP